MIYKCIVKHQRLQPKQKRFDYSIFMLCIDLDERPQLTWLSYNRFNLFSIYDKDHIDSSQGLGIKSGLLSWLETQGISLSGDIRVKLLTFPSVFGYGFNPVSFYYLFEGGKPLFAVAEVVNTYREMKLYIIDDRRSSSWKKTLPKNFYVSPFSNPGDSFDFTLSDLSQDLSIKINNLSEGQPTLISSIQGKAVPLTNTALLRCAIIYPLLSLKIITMIHWQALKLWLKKVPYFKKSDRADAQTERLRPHQSLKK